MWGREPRTSQGPRPSLSLERITEAAIRLADREGLAGVRMGSVAARLGVSTMALYGYVASKDDLLIAMADAATPEPPEPGELSCRAYLSAWTRANRDFLLGHPWLLEVSPLAPPTGPRALRWLDHLLIVLTGAGVAPGEAVNIATSLSTYAVSAASLAHRLRDGTGMTGPGAYSALLSHLVDKPRFPGLSAALDAGAIGSAPEWADDDHAFGLSLLLDGIEALITKRAEETQ
ncbi:TetR/AcrR family transcriptional regulator [Nonomuraea sp. NPDC059007]|uniref:TetR/AcrR family transcriptional regulator n=1 Tax=Nonomuraea sp. NPDC059007 TaxID=3346692 RepID=UPI0036B7F7F6